MGKKLDLTGQRYGMLTVLERVQPAPSGQGRWKCRCDCGRETEVLTGNLRRGSTVSCGCKKYRDLTGMRIGRLTVLERSDQYGPRGARRVQLWKCLCDCGALTYKATDTLTNPEISMCQNCAQQYAIEHARVGCGFVDGTQMSRIQNIRRDSNNATGARGVYLDRQRGKYRARLKFKGKMYSLGCFSTIEDAIKAREEGEHRIFGEFLEEQAAQARMGASADSLPEESQGN